MPDDVPPRRLRPYHAIALIPPIGMLGGIPFANRVEPYVLGLPFLLFWMVAGVIATSTAMAIIFVLDRRQP